MSRSTPNQSRAISLVPVISFLSKPKKAACSSALGKLLARTNMITRVGIVILFLGVSFLIKYAAESITVPIFRVAMNWRAAGLGSHVIEAVAYRPNGVASDPTRIRIEVIARD